ncbi:hypothetical protein [Leptothoe spongobia]|uniref:Uncharacterized protein n=1 Tax=Leptothoe spongobia TAU-MAC 1115 TaxID=1967444 RepID=A0A947GJ61_9CYAN|nr:hypothetical protein [Leptothoe spongobia]MBT9315673.1 hypothetical protein [Leptothoe spongobia TAU-MAC 1115]
MIGRLFTGTILGYISLLALTASSHASTEPVTVDVYGSSYSVELDHEVTDRDLRNQPWWGNKELASELCEALVYQGDEIASIGFNKLEINGEDYIEAYLVMPLTTCSGPVVIAPADIGQMTGGTFFVISGNVCLTNTTDSLSAQVQKNQTSQPILQNVSMLNCHYFNDFILY